MGSVMYVTSLSIHGVSSLCERTVGVFLRVGPRGVDRTIGLVLVPSILRTWRLVACTLRSSIRLFATGFMGYELWEWHYVGMLELATPHTILVGGCGGAIHY
jgi:hypothetical protein